MMLALVRPPGAACSSGRSLCTNQPPARLRPPASLLTRLRSARNVDDRRGETRILVATPGLGSLSVGSLRRVVLGVGVRAPERSVLTRSRPLSDPQRRLQLAELYLRVAETLERSAQLAEQHAQREQTSGRPDSAGVELERAMRAREASRRGRALASRLR